MRSLASWQSRRGSRTRRHLGIVLDRDANRRSGGTRCRSRCAGQRQIRRTDDTNWTRPQNRINDVKIHKMVERRDLVVNNLPIVMLGKIEIEDFLPCLVHGKGMVSVRRGIFSSNLPTL